MMEDNYNPQYVVVSGISNEGINELLILPMGIDIIEFKSPFSISVGSAI